MALDPNVEPFTVNLTGETTGENYTGKFSCKKRLSFREQLAIDQRRRELLGPQGGTATLRAEQAANFIAVLSVRLVEVPSWWKNSDGGLDLADDSVLGGVYVRVGKICGFIDDEEAQAAAKAKEDLKKVTEEAAA
jgi:hypothetical protein